MEPDDQALAGIVEPGERAGRFERLDPVLDVADPDAVHAQHVERPALLDRGVRSAGRLDRGLAYEPPTRGSARRP